MRAYLEYRMKVNGVSRQSIQALIGVTEKTLRNKLQGVTDFTWTEAKKIRNSYFPTEDYDTLFSNDDQDEPKEPKAG